MRCLIENGRAKLPVRANPAALAMARSLEGPRSWLKGGGLSFEDTAYNREIVEQSFPEVEWVEPNYEANAAFDIAGNAAPTRAIIDFRREPDPHQLKGLQKASTVPHFALFMVQGTGKTKIAIDHASRLFAEGKITALLVVSKKGPHRQWAEEELPKDCSVAFEAHYWDTKKKATREKLPNLMAQGQSLKVFTVNYDALRGKECEKFIHDFCFSHRGSLMIVADESQEIKNHKSSRHKAMMRLKPYSVCRWLATGTPIAKDLTDEWSQLLWMDETILGMKYLTSFRSKYCIMGGFEGRQVIGQRNMDEFRSRVDPHSYRVTKEVLGLIPPRWKKWRFDLTPEQRRLMAEVRKALEAECDDGSTVSASTANVAFQKAQQISNGFYFDEDGKICWIMPFDKNPRISAMMEYINDIEGKAIIWGRYRADFEAICSALEADGHSYVEYHGGTSDAARAEAKDSFLREGGARFFVANPASAGTGLNLQGLCNNALYYSNSFSAIDRWQSEDRIHRRGTKGLVVYTDLIAVGGLDNYVLRNLKQKKGIAALSLGDIADAFDSMMD